MMRLLSHFEGIFSVAASTTHPSTSSGRIAVRLFSLCCQFNDAWCDLANQYQLNRHCADHRWHLRLIAIDKRFSRIRLVAACSLPDQTYRPVFAKKQYLLLGIGVNVRPNFAGVGHKTKNKVRRNEPSLIPYKLLPTPPAVAAHNKHPDYTQNDNTHFQMPLWLC